MKKKTIFILILIAIMAFPLDIGVFINRILGWKTHIILYSMFAVFVIYNMKGKTVKDKFINFKKAVWDNGYNKK